VHLTDGRDQALAGFFERMAGNVFLRDFIEVHIREVHGRALTRKTS
jgi:hypothetical protein